MLSPVHASKALNLVEASVPDGLGDDIFDTKDEVFLPLDILPPLLDDIPLLAHVVIRVHLFHNDLDCLLQAVVVDFLHFLEVCKVC